MTFVVVPVVCAVLIFPVAAAAAGSWLWPLAVVVVFLLSVGDLDRLVRHRSSLVKFLGKPCRALIFGWIASAGSRSGVRTFVETSCWCP